MAVATEVRKGIRQELEEAITAASKKVNVKKETDLCHYIPTKHGDRLHHLAFKRMKLAQPDGLLQLLRTHIIENSKPSLLPPKQRSREIVDEGLVKVKLPKSQVPLLISILKKSGNPELASLISSHQTLPVIQRQIISMIRHKAVDQELWNTYVRLVEEEKAKSK